MSRADVRRVLRSQTLTFSSGTSSGPVSSAGYIGDAEFLGFQTSTAFSSTQVSFQVGASSSSTATFYPVYIGSTQLTLTISTAEARFIVADIPQQAFGVYDWLRVVSASTGEAAARTWKLLSK